MSKLFSFIFVVYIGCSLVKGDEAQGESSVDVFNLADSYLDVVFLQMNAKGQDASLVSALSLIFRGSAERFINRGSIYPTRYGFGIFNDFPARNGGNAAVKSYSKEIDLEGTFLKRGLPFDLNSYLSTVTTTSNGGSALLAIKQAASDKSFKWSDSFIKNGKNYFKIIVLSTGKVSVEEAHGSPSLAAVKDALNSNGVGLVIFNYSGDTTVNNYWSSALTTMGFDPKLQVTETKQFGAIHPYTMAVDLAQSITLCARELHKRQRAAFTATTEVLTEELPEPY